MAESDEIAKRPIRWRTFAEAFEVWRKYNELANAGGLEADETEEFRAAEANMLEAWSDLTREV